ncbi:MAG: PIN domain-containing protein [Thermomicrobiales bacterium]|nr:PIN domain-containing protein [Thermomicrobiales bacterium]
MITIDTSALIALMNERDPDYLHVTHAFDSDAGPYIIPAQILAEMAFMIDRRFGHRSVVEFLENLESAQFVIDCGEDDYSRIRQLIVQYADFPLGFADAAVVACAERHGGNVLTLDHRHFGAVARGTAITIYP